ncbi:tetraspanin-8-like [Betta splendens]|uniref:Tetraspanin-8-like n=1 Tax=Betta splendens TaxID=158456 RepID=A0A6P7NDI4_BETSP|nr:tetraspanin-8-like [Betta splendens]
MGKVNVWVKRGFIAATAVSGAISVLLLAFTLFSHGYYHEDEELENVIVALHGMYVISILTLLITIAGMFGALKKKKWALILFAVGMILGSLFMMGCLINALVARPQVAKEMKRHFLDAFHLSNSSRSFLEGFKGAEIEFHCCGLDQGYLDWGYDIPKSCVCAETSTAPCVAAPRNSSLAEKHTGDEPVMIYGEPCIPKIIDRTLGMLGILLGVILGVTLLWVLAVVLCVIILCQLSQKVATPTVEFNHEAKAGVYTILVDPDDT